MAQNIQKEVDRLLKSGSLDGCIDEVDNLLQKLYHAQEEISNDPNSGQVAMAKLSNEIALNEKNFKKSQQQVYNAVTKLGKSMEKTFRPSILDDESKYGFKDKVIPGDYELNKAIAMHMARSGDFDVANTFINEAEISIPDDILNQFANMCVIVQHITSQNLEPAIQWAKEKRNELRMRGSHLEFSLHKVQFIYYLTNHDPAMALNYAQTQLYQFGDRYFDEISQLMNALNYIGKWELSPYDSVIESMTYNKLASLFTEEFCSLLGLSPESPLYLSITAGMHSVPIFTKMQTMMKSQVTGGWTSEDILPVDVPLPRQFNFHPIHVCPVSKEETHESNPPMLLPCNHVVGKDSLISLSEGDYEHPFKCPYCPVMVTFNSSQRIYF